MRSEAQDHRLLAGLLDSLGLVWLHIPMGEATQRRGVQAKALGAKRGAPDIWIFTPPPAYPQAPGAIIELKRSDKGFSAVSQEQRWWLDTMASLGWRTMWGDHDAALAFLEDLGYLD